MTWCWYWYDDDFDEDFDDYDDGVYNGDDDNKTTTKTICTRFCNQKPDMLCCTFIMWPENVHFQGFGFLTFLVWLVNTVLVYRDILQPVQEDTNGNNALIWAQELPETLNRNPEPVQSS